MARTKNPNDSIVAFTADVQAAKSRHATIQSALDAAGASDADKKGATADYIFRIGGEFELFQHNWHIAAISRKPGTFVAMLDAAAATKIQTLQGYSLFPKLASSSPTYPAWPTADQIEKLLDQTERNVTFKNVAEWKKEANKQLDPVFNSKVAQIAQSLEDTWALDLLKSVRNVIAHNSTSSKKDLNKRLVPYNATANPTGVTVGPANAKLTRGTTSGTTSVAPKQVREVSVYLHAVQDGERRADVLVDRVVSIVNKLHVP